MVAFDYSRSVDTATRLIIKYGQEMILVSKIDGPYDPATGESEITSIDINIIGVIFELSGRLIGQSLQNNTLSKSNDKQSFISVGTVPKLLDDIIFGNISYTIINIKELNPGGVVIMYDLVLRNG